jgi:colanic acid biosynthesis glycosyl transferase WcaI
MRIVVHDYAGHPFQVGLSRSLAARGHQVAHLYFANDPGPKAAFTQADDDNPLLQIVPISIGKSYDKGSLLKRWTYDRAYGRRVGSFIDHFAPDVVLSGNTPTNAQDFILSACQSGDVPFIYWLQDFYSIAVTIHLRRRLGPLSPPIAWYYRLTERRQLRESEAVIAITDDFVPLAAKWAGNPRSVVVIENWAAIKDVPVLPKDNAWARSQGIEASFNYLYSGTLGLKHKPELLVELAGASHADTSVVVVAKGLGVAPLQAACAQRGIDNVKLMPLQPEDTVPHVLGSADVLLATIDRDSGRFAVPSKVQTYLCAGRPILLAAPRENLAARTIIKANAGIVVDPDDTNGFLDAARTLQTDAQLRAELGANGRAYAEKMFDLEAITDAFEQVMTKPLQKTMQGSMMPLARQRRSATATPH